MDDKINEAIKLLRDNDYVVIRLSKSQRDDMAECEESDFEKDCTGCSCSCCVVD